MRKAILAVLITLAALITLGLATGNLFIQAGLQAGFKLGGQ